MLTRNSFCSWIATWFVVSRRIGMVVAKVPVTTVASYRFHPLEAKLVQPRPMTRMKRSNV